jgi:hypothetical protein
MLFQEGPPGDMGLLTQTADAQWERVAPLLPGKLGDPAGWRRITRDKQKENLSDEDFEPLIPTGGRPHV